MKLEYVVLVAVVFVVLIVLATVVVPAAQTQIAEALAPVQAALESVPTPTP